jgi:hypothetical protein
MSVGSANRPGRGGGPLPDAALDARNRLCRMFRIFARLKATSAGDAASVGLHQSHAGRLRRRPGRRGYTVPWLPRPVWSEGVTAAVKAAVGLAEPRKKTLKADFTLLRSATPREVRVVAVGAEGTSTEAFSAFPRRGPAVSPGIWSPNRQLQQGPASMLPHLPKGWRLQVLR